MMSTNLINVFDDILQTVPDQVALIHGQERITYRELDARSRAVGAFFQMEGVEPGTRALLLIPLGIEFYVIFLGLIRIGVTAMLIDPAVGRTQMAACCRMAQPDLLIGSPKAHLLRLFNSTIRRIPRKFSPHCHIPGSTLIDYQRSNGRCRDDTGTPHNGCSDVTGRPNNGCRDDTGTPHNGCRDVTGTPHNGCRDDTGTPHNGCCDDTGTPETPALITFTSGSTGEPKGICRTHGFLLQQHAVLCRAIPARAGDVEMNTLPVFILSSLARGLTVVMPQSFGGKPSTVNAAEVIEELQTHRVNRLLAAPAFCDQLAEQLTTMAQTLSTIERVYTGGGPVFPSLVDKLQRQMPNAAITAVYGSTEAEPIAHINLSALLSHDQQAMARGQGLLAGKPIHEIHLAILPDLAGEPIGPFTEESFATEKLPANCAGEIVVCGDHVQKGYLGGDDGLTKFCVGEAIWHRTGDAGYVDGFGRLWLLGRCSARMGREATARYPFGMEVAAMSHPAVQRAAFVEVDGEGVLAVQTAYPQWAAVAQSLRATLPTVAHITRLESIPVDARHGSKVRYGDVRKLIAGRPHFQGSSRNRVGSS